MKTSNYDSLILMHPAVMDAAGDGLHYLFSTFILSWLLIFAGAGSMMMVVGKRLFPKSFGTMESSQQYKLVFWALEAVVGVMSIIEMMLWVPECIFVYGTIHPSRITGEIDDDWSDPVGWVQNVEQAYKIIGWAVAPLLLPYFITICCFVDQFQPRAMVMLHHLICIGCFFFVLNAILSTLDAHWMQIALLFSLNISLEFPIMIALILYRFQHWMAPIMLRFAIGYEVVLRIFVWGCATVNYYNLCFLSPTTTTYEDMWRYFYPVLLVSVFTIELYTIWIHYRLYLQSVNRRIIGGERNAASTARTMKSKNEKGCDTSVVNKRRLTKGERVSVFFVIDIVFIAILAIVFTNPYILPIVHRDSAVPSKKTTRIAIVGGGVSGLGAALAFQQAQADGGSSCEIDLFEAHNQLGGAASTYFHGEPFEAPFTEHGFLAFRDYFNFEQLLEYLGVEYERAVGSVTIQYETNLPFENTIAGSGMDKLNSGDVAGASLPHSFRNRNRIFKYVDQMERMSNQLTMAFNYWNEFQLMETTLADFTAASNGVYTEDFLHDYLKPCLTSYVATGEDVFKMPVSLLYAFESRYGLCLSLTRTKANYIKNGTSSYVNKLQQLLNESGMVNFHLNNAIVAARMANQQVGGVAHLLDSNGVWREYDHVIFTLQRPILRRIFDHPSSELCGFAGKLKHGCTDLYQQLFPTGNSLGNIKRTIIHDDIAFMERYAAGLRSDDGCAHLEIYNYWLRNHGTKVNEDTFVTTIMPKNKNLMTCHQELRPPFTMSTHQLENRVLEDFGFSMDRVLDERQWLHPSHDVRFFKMGRSSHALQGLGSFWFAGAAFNLNFHEEAFVSGLVIAERLGAGYMFDNCTFAKQSFLRSRGWILYGINPLLAPFVPSGSKQA